MVKISVIHIKEGVVNQNFLFEGEDSEKDQVVKKAEAKFKEIAISIEDPDILLRMEKEDWDNHLEDGYLIGASLDESVCISWPE